MIVHRTYWILDFKQLLLFIIINRSYFLVDPYMPQLGRLSVLLFNLSTPLVYN